MTGCPEHAFHKLGTSDVDRSAGFIHSSRADTIHKDGWRGGLGIRSHLDRIPDMAPNRQGGAKEFL